MKFTSTTALISSVIMPLFFAASALSSTTTPNKNKFVCEINSLGTPTTRLIYQDGRTKKDFISYIERHFEPSGFTPSKRCRLITDRINSAVNSAIESNKVRKLVLVADRKNGYDVLCFADNDNSPCKTFLLTLRPKKNVFDSANKIMVSLKSDESTEPYYETGCSKKGECKRVVIPMYRLLMK